MIILNKHMIMRHGVHENMNKSNPTTKNVFLKTCIYYKAKVLKSIWSKKMYLLKTINPEYYNIQLFGHAHFGLLKARMKHH